MENFLEISTDRKVYQDDYFFIIRDAFPVSPGHLLIISNDLKKDFFELTKEQKQHLIIAIERAKEIVEQDHNPDGYNIGMNCGESAGQTLFHFHCHVIPRYKGDMVNPKGGIRHCLTGKGYY